MNASTKGIPKAPSCGQFAELAPTEERGAYRWYDACERAAGLIGGLVPVHYRTRTFSGVIGDVKALPPRKALSLFSRKRGLGIQYAHLYLTRGIDGGYGYQACASEALKSALGEACGGIAWGDTLDVGCAVGISAGVLGISRLTGFDLFPDLLRTARLVDTLTGSAHRYAVADMTGAWPFADRSFDTVTCGLVCHHLKEQREVRSFFTEANRVLRPDGTLLITLPAGSVAKAGQFAHLLDALEGFGFRAGNASTGLVVSTDSAHSLFWMFLVTARKKAPPATETFIHPDFGFPDYRTPVSREEKGSQARATSAMKRRVRHRSFRLIGTERMAALFGNDNLVFSTISGRCTFSPQAGHHED